MAGFSDKYPIIQTPQIYVMVLPKMIQIEGATLTFSKFNFDKQN